MTITIHRGDIFASGADVLCSPVDCTGAQGKGLALAFKRRFPAECASYAADCRRYRMQPGGVRRVLRVLFVATKDHWRNPSRIEWIADACDNIATHVELAGVKSIAVPALGCGLGGLAWSDVKRVMMSGLARIDAHVMVYEPA